MTICMNYVTIHMWDSSLTRGGEDLLAGVSLASSGKSVWLVLGWSGIVFQLVPWASLSRYNSPSPYLPWKPCTYTARYIVCVCVLHTILSCAGLMSGQTSPFQQWTSAVVLFPYHIITWGAQYSTVLPYYHNHCHTKLLSSISSTWWLLTFTFTADCGNHPAL